MTEASLVRAYSLAKSLCFGLSVGLAMLSCRSSHERELTAEVARIAAAVNQLRDAPNNEKSVPLTMLQGESCVHPRACELKQICLQAYTLHEKSIEATNRIRELMRQNKADPQRAAELLAVSESDLEHARRLMGRCVDLQGALERDSP